MIEMLPTLLVIGTSLWVLFDARSIGVEKGKIRGFFNMGPTGWFLSCILCWIVAFPAYLVKRREYMRIPSAAPASPPPASSDFMSQLGVLADLYQQGLLTEEEFQARKKQLVHQMLEEDTVSPRIRPEPPPPPKYVADQKPTV